MEWLEHIPDDELLLAGEGEIASARLAEIQAHLNVCRKCRERGEELERSVAGLVEFYHAASRTDLPAMEGPRAQLRGRLREVTAERESHRSAWFTPRQVVFGGLAVVCVAAGAMLFPFLGSGSRAGGKGLIPNARLTPGATVPISLGRVCMAEEGDEVRVVDASLAHRVFDEYGIRNPAPRAYEVDYLITPALGGSDDLRNLWPQPYTEGEWNSRVKDALEDRLRELVCSGKIDLATAQRDIAQNWIRAYQKYFRTPTPLVSHARFVKDKAWE